MKVGDAYLRAIEKLAADSDGEDKQDMQGLLDYLKAPETEEGRARRWAAITGGALVAHNAVDPKTFDEKILPAIRMCALVLVLQHGLYIHGEDEKPVEAQA